MKYIKTFNESKEITKVTFVKQPKKAGAKTETYNVL